MALTAKQGKERHVDYFQFQMQKSAMTAQPIDVVIAANAYRNDGPWTFSVAPNETADRSWRVSASGNWYDFTVSAAGFERRFAGRMENGRSSLSDPAM
jgi:phospholipase C